MALQTSGAISLNQIHIEAEGTSGTTVSLNDSDIRSLGGVASGAIDFADFYGASLAHTLVQGSSGGINFGYSSGVDNKSAFSGSSLTPNTLNGVTIRALYFTNVTFKGSTTRVLELYLDGNRASNFFASISDTPGSLPNQPLTSSNASSAYTSQYDYTRYFWTLPSDPSNWDGSGSFTVTFT